MRVFINYRIKPRIFASIILILIFLFLWKSTLPAIPNNIQSQQKIDQIYSANSDEEMKTYSPPPFRTKEPESKNILIDLDDILDSSLEQDDPTLISYIRKNNIFIPPSNETYDLVIPNEDPSLGQSDAVKKILKNMKGGFFVECGALDGEYASNTLNLEDKFGWKGLLVEADPINFDMLLNKHRKAWAANVCLSIKPYPHKAMFVSAFDAGQIVGQSSENYLPDIFENGRPLNKIQCYPLFSLLKALNVDTVDYFSLDVEGNELSILETIPFDKILIKVISVEYMNYDLIDKSEILTKFMDTKGYRVVNKVNVVIIEKGSSDDLIFVHSSVLTDENETNDTA